MKKCCGTSVGVLIGGDLGRLLLIKRALPPVGWAPPAGHALDEHASFLAAAVEEVAEETGLTVADGDLKLLYESWMPNRCRRIPHPAGGHDWQVYRARRWSGPLTPSKTEAAGAGWYTPSEVQALADRTVAWARGEITDAEFATHPGLEPVWVVILAELFRASGFRTSGLIDVRPDDLARVQAVAETPPPSVTASR